MEHIATPALSGMMRRLEQHLAPGGICIFSIADFPYVGPDGSVYHQTVQPLSWWVDFYKSAGFQNHPEIVAYFGEDWIRGNLQGTRGYHVALTRIGDPVPQIPNRPALSPDDLTKCGFEFLRQGIANGNAGGYAGNVQYSIHCFDRRLAEKYDAETMYGRALALQALGLHDEARKSASLVLNSNPNHAGARQIVQPGPQIFINQRASLHPKISVITPSYNCAKFIGQMIESMRAQNYGNIEHIFMDGGSKDGTVEILQKYPHIRWISEPDKGEGDALNKALRMVTGDIIHWLNADDWIEPGVYARVAQELNPAAGRHVVYGKTKISDEQGKTLWFKNSDPNMSLPRMLRWWSSQLHPHQPSCFYSRQMMEDLGPFDSSLHYSLDYEYWLRAIVKYKFHYVDMLMSTMRTRENCKSIGDEGKGIISHLRVSLPYLRFLDSDQRIAYWTEYYQVILEQYPSPLAYGSAIVPPVTREATVGLAMLLANHPDKVKTQDFVGQVLDKCQQNEQSQLLARLTRQQNAVTAPSN